MFYTYLWLREDGTPYYVGKGQRRRGLRSCAHNVNCPKDASRIIVQEWPSEKDAFEAEKFLIAYYGRKDLGTGPLRNHTDGGQGMSGYKHTESAKQRLRELGLGRPSGFRGKEHSVETLAHLRDVQRPQYCQRGHEFTLQNTYVRPDTGRRQCKACRDLRISCPR